MGAVFTGCPLLEIIMPRPSNTLSNGEKVEPTIPYVRVSRTHEMVHDPGILYNAALLEMAEKKVPPELVKQFDRDFREARKGDDETTVHRAMTDCIKRWVNVVKGEDW